MITKKTIRDIIFLAIFLIAGLVLSEVVLAQTCPENTTAEKTQATLVGRATDSGSDPYLTVWFQYGKTASYGYETPHQSQYGVGKFCATVYNLEPCVTYHYRGIARNSVGTSYGQDKSFTTTCGLTTVDIKANSFDGAIVISYNTSAFLSWTSTNANYCTASGDWSGSKSVSGSESTGNLISSKTYTLTCSGSAGSASDNVIVNIGSPSLSVSLSSSPSSGCVPLNSVDLTASVSGSTGGNITYYFDCTNDGTWERIITNSSYSYTAYDVCNFGLTGNYTAKVKIETQGVSAENTASINVLSCQSPSPVSGTLTVNKWVRNLSDGTGWGDSVSADPSEVMSFLIEVTANNSSLQNVLVKDTLPDKITYRANTLKIDGVSSAGDIFSGLNIGSLSVNQKKTITFDADVSRADRFVFGDTQLINSALAYTVNTSGSDTAKIIVTRKAVLGAATTTGATTISTGLTDNIFFDSFIIPLVIALIITWLLRSNIIKFEQWLDGRKMGYQKYRSAKLLQIKIARVKAQELFRRIF